MRRMPKIDPAKDKLVEDMLKPEPSSEPIDISIDQLMNKTLRAIDLTLAGTIAEIKTHGGATTPSRECVANLKDCLSMLSDLKKKEQDLLDSMTDEALENLKK